MAVKQHFSRSSKGRKSRKFCFSWWGCCGVSSRVSAYHRADGKTLVKSDAVFDPLLPVETAVCTSKEIHVVVEAEERKNQIIGLPINKKSDKSENNSKEMTKSGPVLNSMNKTIDDQKRLVQEGVGTATTRISSSIFLPQPQALPKKVNMPKNKKEMKPVDGGGELDSMVGAVIVMVTLMVMLICGKVCAILCTAVWLYFIPRLRTNKDSSEFCTTGILPKDGRDMDSWEYKKRVVLEGLLQRNHH